MAIIEKEIKYTEQIACDITDVMVARENKSWVLFLKGNFGEVGLTPGTKFSYKKLNFIVKDETLAKANWEVIPVNIRNVKDIEGILNAYRKVFIDDEAVTYPYIQVEEFVNGVEVYNEKVSCTYDDAEDRVCQLFNEAIGQLIPGMKSVLFKDAVLKLNIDGISYSFKYVQKAASIYVFDNGSVNTRLITFKIHK